MTRPSAFVRLVTAITPAPETRTAARLTGLRAASRTVTVIGTDRIPGHDRNLRLVARGDEVDVRPRIRQVVTQVEVLDARRAHGPDGPDVVKRLHEVGAEVPDTRVAGLVEGVIRYFAAPDVGVQLSLKEENG